MVMMLPKIHDQEIILSSNVTEYTWGKFYKKEKIELLKKESEINRSHNVLNKDIKYFC